METIIAGGRSYQLTPNDLASLDQLHTEGIITSVVHGGAPGVDTAAGQWAMQRGLAVLIFRADWARDGKKAGPVRNQAMVDHVGKGGALIIIPGGRGTLNVLKKAGQAGLKLIDRTSALLLTPPTGVLDVTYEEKLVQFAEAVLVEADRERAWYQTPAGHMRTLCDPRYPYSVCLRLLRDASHLEIDMGEVEQHYRVKCLASLKDLGRENL